MELRRVQTQKAPAAIGPYSQAITTGAMIFTAGQIPLDPKTMRVVDGGITEQTESVMQHLETVLEEAGAALETVVKTTVFLQDLEEFDAMNEVYTRYFKDHKPARSAVQVARLPKDVRVEIEAIAVVR